MEILEICRGADPVVIIGAGASGLLSATALLRAGHHEVVLVEQDRSWSTGPAYATEDAKHLLNVPASKLSADSARPCDFLDWASARVPSVTAGAFLPRRLFGEYLRDSLDAAARAARPEALTRVTAEAVVVDRGCTHDRGAERVRVTVRDGRSIIASHVVLALGSPPPRPLACDSGTVIDDPWSACASRFVSPDDSIVVVGSGLTAVDLTLTFAARGHRGPMRIVSRHGLLPRVHDAAPTRPFPADPSFAPTARAAMAWMRAAIADVDGDWRAVFDAIRPRTSEIWCSLPESERARLLRRTARYWEVHRHRMAPEVAQAFGRLVSTGRVQLVLGDARCGDTMSAFGAKWVINCTGPNFDLRDSQSPLIGSLLRGGAARPGPLGLGFDVTADGALVDASGRASTVVSVVGPLRRGAEWETTAIPEIRTQAEKLARLVVPDPSDCDQSEKSGRAALTSAARPFGSSHASWRPSAVMSRK